MTNFARRELSEPSMMRCQKSPKPESRNERHSATWGKRVSIVLLLLTRMAFGQHAGELAQVSARNLDPEVTRWAGRHAASDTLRVIVQYKHAPLAATESRLQGHGARLS